MAETPRFTDVGSDAPGGGAEDVSGGRLVENFLALLAAQMVAAVAGLISTAFLARSLAPEAYGFLGFGTAVLSYFGLLVVFGTDTIGMREIARNPSTAGPLISRILGLRVALLAIVSVLFLFVVGWMDRPEEVKIVMVIQGAGLFVTVFALDFVFQGIQRMGAIALRQAAAAVLLLAGVVLWIRTPDDLYLAAAIPVLAVGLTTICLIVHLRRRVAKISISFDVSGWRPLIGNSAPILVGAFLGVVFFNIDVVMLGFMADASDVGLYVGMSRVYVTALMLGNLIGSVFSPALAAAYPRKYEMARRHDDFVAAVMFVGAPIAALAVAFPRDIIEIMFGVGFLEGEAALIVLMLSVLVYHFTIAASAALIAWNDQTAQMFVYGAGACANVALNLVLIPPLGIEGAALATLAAQFVILIGLSVRMRTKFELVSFGKPLLLSACAAAAFAIVMFFAQVTGGALIADLVAADFVLKVVLGGGLYLLFAVLTKAVRPERLLDAVRATFDRRG